MRLHNLIAYAFFGMIAVIMSIKLQAGSYVSSAGADRRIDLSVISPRPVLPIRIFYRLRQFVRGITAHVSADEMLVAAQVLPRAALARFCHMPLDAQRHSLNVLYMLQRDERTTPDLAAAALLHDVGKCAVEQVGFHLSPWLRGPLVLFEALTPDLVAKLARNDPAQGWRYLLHVHLAHATIGAAWAADAECSELTCWLIKHHQDKLTDAPQSDREELLALLQWADSRN
jgi:hypothetical protein